MSRNAECLGAGDKRHGEPGQLGGTAPPSGEEGFSLGDVLLCVTLTVPLEGKKRQEGHEMSGLGLCHATWPGTPGPGGCKPERWMLRGRLLFCSETGHGADRVGKDLK